MKYFIFYITMLLSCSSLLQAQEDDYIPMLQDGNVWTISSSQGGIIAGTTNKYTTVKIAGDSLINGKVYKKLVDSTYLNTYNYETGMYDTISYPFKLLVLLREENKQVIGYNNATATEGVVYDFNIQVGDYIPKDMYAYSRVQSSGDTILADGLSHRYFEIVDTCTFMWCGSTCSPYLLIEGVGTNEGFYAPANCVYFEQVSSSWLNCLNRNGNAIYGCGVPDDTLSVPVLALPPQRVSVSPNPAVEWVEFRAAMPLEWRIYDVRGVLRYRSGGAQSYLPLSLQGWQSGVYYYQATDGRGQYSGKFLVCP
ncbi:MAG: T9SS type A sorting domain-containing protein [Sphingobacteriales bacterium]|nr:T9SS type A sorting domain-containing protein [Sphingobacteriales bacterium]